MFSENSGEEDLFVLFMSCTRINSAYDHNFACGFMHLIMDDAHLSMFSKIPRHSNG